MLKPLALLIKPSDSSFIRIDEEILSQKYRLQSLNLMQSSGRLTYLLRIGLMKLCLFLHPGIRFVFIWFADYHAFPAVLISRMLRKKAIIFIGGMDAVCYPKLRMGVYCSPIRGFCASFALRHCNLIIANHEALIASDNLYYNPTGHPEGIRNLIPNLKTPTAVVYNGIRILKGIDLHSNRGNTILSVGTTPRLNDFYNKGFDLVFKVARNHPEWIFTIVGIGEHWLEPLLESKVITPLPNLKIIPHLPHNELIHLYQHNQVYVQASISEGMPNSLMEAMLCGCVPIGSRVAGIVPLISDKGFLLDQAQETELTALIEQALVIRNREPISKHIECHFSLRNRSDNLHKLLEQTLS